MELTIESVYAYLKDGKIAPCEKLLAARELAQQYRLHSKGEQNTPYANRVLYNRHPSEAEVNVLWRKKNFTPITRPLWERAVAEGQRIFEAKYVINTSEDLTTLRQSAIWGNPDDSYADFMGMMQLKMWPLCAEDPNGIAVVVPTGDGLEDDAVQIVPNVYLYPTDRIAHITRESVLIEFKIKKDQRILPYSSYYDDNSPLPNVQHTVLEYMLVNEYGWYIIKKAENDTWYLEAEFPNRTGLIPFVQLGGYPDRFTWFSSFFGAIVPHANKALRQDSDSEAQLKMAGNATRVIKPTQTCPTCKGGTLSGLWGIDPRTDIMLGCPSCGGTGFIVEAGSPFTTITLAETDPDTQPDNKPALEYIAPPLEPVKFAYDLVDRFEEKAMAALSMQRIDEAQSGVAKLVDRQGLETRLNAIKQRFFNHTIPHLLRVIEYLIHPIGSEKRVEPAVSAPIALEVRTEAEITLELQTLIEKGAPAPLIRDAYMDLMNIRYNGDSAALAYHSFLILYDPFIPYSVTQFREYKAAFNGTITALDIARHLYGDSTLSRMVKSKGETWLIQSAENYDALAAEVDAALPQVQNSLTLTTPA